VTCGRAMRRRDHQHAGMMKHRRLCLWMCVGSLLLLATTCGWLLYSPTHSNTLNTIHSALNEHIIRRKKDHQGVPAPPQEAGDIKPPSHSLIDFVDDESPNRADDQDEEALFQQPTGGTSARELPSFPPGGISLRPPCLTVKYLMGLTTTAMERDWIYFDLLSALPNCSIRYLQPRSAQRGSTNK